MPGGVVFLVCIPTFNYEHELVFGVPLKRPKNIEKGQIATPKVNLRLKEIKTRTQQSTLNSNELNDAVEIIDDENNSSVPSKRYPHSRGFNSANSRTKSPIFVSMETVLAELLKKLEVEHVVWCKDKQDMYYEVIFPVPAGDTCENCLHCLTEMGIGVKMNSIVSVIPTQCTYSGLGNCGTIDIKKDIAYRQKESEERKDAWAAFVESIRSKLTVKQVVDGVRSGGDLTFDYVLLVLTAE